MKLEADVPPLVAAGRTDKGVHATGQVVHVDMARDWDPFRLSGALNYHLKPQPVAIVACAHVADDFHARFHALERRYLFRLVSRRAQVVLERDIVWRVSNELDLDAMRAGAAYLIGRHDFTTFRATHCQALSPIKTLDKLEVTAKKISYGIEYQFEVEARSFLHNQVRSFVGTLERVGAGTWSPEDVRDALEARDRSACGPVSPALGLALVSVRYPTDPFI
ncbi:MAG: tRNA pseudouridine38-40 synthase [Polaromonas sp.]|jgi:tRNA pseudouridine38-40 synthase